ncbi:hypothetical protein PPO43_03300 [Saprospira sp. CCB-QB6]|nr:hypothetical protein [Saprospira sp. CCB-QB6]WCL82128.1 hypothetical protein PPO43_03300 [Saprospira sp. CCB-QB6]
MDHQIFSNESTQLLNFISSPHFFLQLSQTTPGPHQTNEANQPTTTN